MEPLAELLERVKAATGPDRLLDLAIAQTLNQPWQYTGEPPQAIYCGKYTASLDVALALVERVLPGTKKAFSHRNYQYDGWIVTLVPETGLAEQWRSAQPELAVLTALLSVFVRRAAQTAVGSANLNKEA